MTDPRRTFLRQLAACCAGLSMGASPAPAGMLFRSLGLTGEKVSLLGLGGSHMSDQYGVTEKEALSLMHTAIDQGVNFFDNAWNYSGGISEVRMGKALAGGYRSRVFLMTKEQSRDPAVAVARLEGSLRRLQTDWIDLWQFHSIMNADDPSKIYEEGLIEAALRAREDGKIRFVGFTGHRDPYLLVEMIERGFRWDTVQMPVNILDPHYLSFVENVLPIAIDRGIGVIAMKTLAGSPGVIPGSGIAAVAECLRFAMSMPVSTVVSGMDSLAKLRHNLTVARRFVPMDEAELRSVIAATQDAGMYGEHESYKRRRS